ncbi:MAG: NAD(P)H-hydrate dehydratase [Alphaproteobacteria bacterium]
MSPADRAGFTAPSAALLSVEQCYAADRAAARSGVATIDLMERAGRAVTAAVRARYAPCPTTVLCGPGNNGGDGFVAARLLAGAGWPVRLGLLGESARLTGDAATMAGRWRGAVEPMGPELVHGARLVVDAVFGAGLARPVEGDAARTLEAARASGAPVVAVDVPSGVAGDTGAALGPVCPARLTVTFFRRKPGHVLLPGRTLCGEVIVGDIGIPESVLDGLGVATWANEPELWERALPWPGAEDHKYSRGHVLVIGGGATSSGAARLAALAALRAGAGAVTTVVGHDAAAVHAAQQTSVMIAVADDVIALRRQLADARRNALLIGPGAGTSAATRESVLALLATGRAIVLDADALTVFADDRETLLRALGPHVLLTPHDGEYRRLFPHQGDRLARARLAAEESGAVVLLKGADTVVAAPDGRAAINTNAPPWLATAGAGDVLAGLAVGLMAQGLDAFRAGAAAAWLHGVAAAALGPGLISEDLVDAIPDARARLAARGT